MVMKESLFATPQSWSELLNWLNLHPKDDVKPLTYAAVLGYNFVINQLNADNPTIPFPKYRITSSDLPKFDNYQEILQWITEFPKDNHVWLLTAQAMGQNFRPYSYYQRKLGVPNDKTGYTPRYPPAVEELDGW